LEGAVSQLAVLTSEKEDVATHEASRKHVILQQEEEHHSNRAFKESSNPIFN